MDVKIKKINKIKRTSYFKQATGVRQGCTLSPRIFNLYINDLAENIENSKSPGLTIEGREIKCLFFADDLLLRPPTKDALQESLSILENYSETWNLRTNRRTKLMIFQKKHCSKRNRSIFHAWRGQALSGHHIQILCWCIQFIEHS